MNSSSGIKIHNCKRCGLHLSRVNIVPGEGDITSKVMIIGEAPGNFEDLTGRPFIDNDGIRYELGTEPRFENAGTCLTHMLNKVGINRRDLYITNVVKCRPVFYGKNTKPTQGQIVACSPYLKYEITKLVSPKIILLLGSVAMNFFIEGSITKNHGRLFKWENHGKIRFLLPTFHPAFILRNNSYMGKYEEDFTTFYNLIQK